MVSDRDSTTVAQYIEKLDPDRQPIIEAIHQVVVDNLPDGYEEVMLFGMPTYVIPLERYPDTYNKKPLAYVSFAAQKNYNSLYLMALYSNSEEEKHFVENWAGGKKLNMGKCCVRFKKLEDIDLPLIAETIAAVSVDQFLETYERIR